VNRELVQLYAAGADKLAMAVRGLTREDMLCLPAPDSNVGKWSIQQVVLHLADCEQVYADRIKRVIAEENPTLLAFDENKWAAALHYNEQSAEDAVQLVELTRKGVATTLRHLSDAAFTRAGTHSEAGRKTLAELIKTAVDHLDHHVGFIHAKRAKMGKEMW
jgi:uncharacterized damage-inducible protein DinB